MDISPMYCVFVVSIVPLGRGVRRSENFHVEKTGRKRGGTSPVMSFRCSFGLSARAGVLVLESGERGRGRGGLRV